MEVHQEKIGDLPLIAQIIKSSGLMSCIDKYYPTHGNWRSPSIGNLMLGWLMYIISENDHRVYKVEDWAKEHLVSLRWALDAPDLTSKSFQDDRLANLLERFSDKAAWNAMLSEHNAHLIRLYELPTDIARVDSVNIPAYRDPEEGSLFQFGHRKNHQPNLPQVKTMLVSLDPLALPITSITVDGKRSDEPLYIPAIEQARAALGATGMLYVGDSKLCNLENCSYIASTGNFYMGPLSRIQYSEQSLRVSVLQALEDKKSWQSISRIDPKTKELEAFGQAYELSQRERCNPQTQVWWYERLIAILDPVAQSTQKESLEKRLKMAQLEILERFIPKKRRLIFKEEHRAEANAFINKVLTKFKVKAFLETDLFVAKEVTKDKDPLYIKITLKEQEIADFNTLAGWRIYATNAPLERLQTKDVLPCYRQEFLIEQQFHKLLTKTTSLLPLYLKDEGRIDALIRILCLALQFVATIQYTARQELAKQNDKMDDLVPGNKGRKTEKPTAEILLKRFSTVTAVWIVMPNQPVIAKLINFDPVHTKILKILNCPHDLYLKFINAFDYVNELAPS